MCAEVVGHWRSDCRGNFSWIQFSEIAIGAWVDGAPGPARVARTAVKGRASDRAVPSTAAHQAPLCERDARGDHSAAVRNLIIAATPEHLIDKLKQLSPTYLAEVEDFVDFLAERQARAMRG